MPTLFTATCAQGRLTITDTAIIIERGTLNSTMLTRQACTGVSAKMTMWFFGWTRYRLVFRGQGSERLYASNISKRTVRNVQALLTGR